MKPVFDKPPVSKLTLCYTDTDANLYHITGNIDVNCAIRDHLSDIIDGSCYPTEGHELSCLNKKSKSSHKKRREKNLNGGAEGCVAQGTGSVAPTVFVGETGFNGIATKKEEEEEKGSNHALGRFKDETKGRSIFQYIGLRPKLYAFRFSSEDQTNNVMKKAKGIKRSHVESELM